MTWGMILVLIPIVIICVVIHALIIGAAIFISNSRAIMTAIDNDIDKAKDKDKESEKKEEKRIGRIRTERQIGFNCKWDEELK